jgi:biotin transport system substrate-specific component
VAFSGSALNIRLWLSAELFYLKGVARMPPQASSIPNLVPLVWSSLFTALIATGALLSLPLGPIPFVLSNFFVFLSGLILGPFWGGLSVALYLALGALGLPVFANGTGGLSVLFGPTSGFLFGFLLAVIVIGLLRDSQGKGSLRNAIALLVGILLIYATGIPLYALLAHANPVHVLIGSLGLFLGDLLKAGLALVLTKTLYQGLPILKTHRKKS